MSCLYSCRGGFHFHKDHVEFSSKAGALTVKWYTMLRDFTMLTSQNRDNWKESLSFHDCLPKGVTNFECLLLNLHTLNYHTIPLKISKFFTGSYLHIMTTHSQSFDRIDLAIYASIVWYLLTTKVAFLTSLFLFVNLQYIFRHFFLALKGTGLQTSLTNVVLFSTIFCQRFF